MRLFLLAIVICTAVAGAFGVYSSTLSGKAKQDFSARYLQSAKNDPEGLRKSIGKALSSCLKADDRRLVADAKVSDLAIRTLFKTGVFMAQGKAPDQSAKEFIPWIMRETAPFNTKQKADYLKLFKTSLNDQNTTLCVFSAIKTSLADEAELRTEGWQLRS